MRAAPATSSATRARVPQDRLVRRVERLFGAARHRRELLGVPEPLPLFDEPLLLVGRGSERVDLADLEREEILPLHPIPHPRRQRPEGGACLRGRLVGAGHFGARALEPCEGVEVVEVGRRVDETVMLVLRRDVGQARRELAELRRRCEPAVHVGPRSAGRLHHAPDDQLVLVRLEPRRIEPRPQGRVRADLEERLDLRRFLARAHDVGPSARPEHELDRVDQDRLARARLSGDDVEPRPQLELEPIDDGEVTNAQAGEHGASRASGTTEPRSRGVATEARLRSRVP